MAKFGVKNRGVESEKRAENGKKSPQNEQIQAFLDLKTQKNEG